MELRRIFRTSRQNNIVLLLRIEAFHLKRNLFSYEIAQHGQMGAFLFQKQVHNGLRSQYAKLFRVELPRLPQYFTQYYIADCARSAEHTSELQSLMRFSYAVF